MIYLDLLYPSKELREKSRNKKRISENLPEDLQLREIIGSDLLDKKEFEQFCTEISFLPAEEEVIRYRQAVLEDFINNPRFIKNLLEIFEKLSEKLPERKYSSYRQPLPFQEKLKDYLTLLKTNVQALYHNPIIPEKELKSEVLKNLVYFLNNKEYENHLKEILAQVKAVLDAQAVGYCVDYTYGQAMNTVRITCLKNDNVIPMKEGKGLLRSKVVDSAYYIDSSGDTVLYNNINDIYTNTLIKLSDFIIKMNNKIVIALKQIYRDSSYYKAGVGLYRLCRSLKLPVCKPEVLTSEDNTLVSMGLYSIYLAAKLDREAELNKFADIRSNDYTNCDGRIAIITGINSGGKTIFLQSLGMAQILLQLGFYVPAVSYSSSIAGYIGTLYAMSEDVYTVHGKLEQELVGIKKISQQIERHSLILINELLASTSEEDGTQIAAEVLRAFAGTHSNILFVTHLYELAMLAEAGKLLLPEGEKAVNYVTERIPDEVGELHGTYRIIPGIPLNNIWEKNMLEKYSLLPQIN